ncbi:hypothetical protein SAMN04487782_0201 [Stenotrophomonas maltophilia]|nr:hypothetical protein SAMN04487782_0201 [Stenotrophomonas maltophilia]
MVKFPFRMAACVAALLVLLAMTLVVASRRSADSTQSPTASTEAALHGAPASAAAAGTGQARPVLSPMARYREAARLDLLIADLAQRSRSGDADASLALSRIYDECTMFLGPAAIATIDIPAERRAALIRSHAWLQRRCAGFSPGIVEGIRNVRHYRSLAARQGSLVAQIEEQIRHAGFDLPLADHRTLIEAVLLQDDGEAYLALSNLMGSTAADRRQQLQAVPAGSEVAAAAWILAGCRLGVPCGIDSPLLNRLCGQAGMCGPESVEDLFTSNLQPEDRDAAQAGADAIFALAHRMGREPGL